MKRVYVRIKDGQTEMMQAYKYSGRWFIIKEGPGAWSVWDAEQKEWFNRSFTKRQEAEKFLDKLNGVSKIKPVCRECGSDDVVRDAIGSSVSHKKPSWPEGGPNLPAVTARPR